MIERSICGYIKMKKEYAMINNNTIYIIKTRLFESYIKTEKGQIAIIVMIRIHCQLN